MQSVVTIRRVLIWLAISFAASAFSVLVTAYFNSLGTVVGSVSASENAEWEQFHHEFPTKNRYTEIEFERRGAEIHRIQDKYNNIDVVRAGYLENRHLFFWETVNRSLKYSWVIWFFLPLLFRLSVRSIALIMVFPVLFWSQGFFYLIELTVFLGALSLGWLLMIAIQRRKTSS